MTQMQECASSMVSEIGYNAERSAIYVRFAKSNKLYRYDGCSQGDFDAMVQAPSVGSYINGYLKQNFTATAVDAVD